MKRHYKIGDIVFLTDDKLAGRPKGTKGVVSASPGGDTNYLTVLWAGDYQAIDTWIGRIGQSQTNDQMAVGKQYTSNASTIKRKVTCVGHDQGRCIIRPISGCKNYESVVGHVGTGKYDWTPYYEPVIEERYTWVNPNKWGTACNEPWCLKREDKHNIRGTFADDVLTKVEQLW